MACGLSGSSRACSLFPGALGAGVLSGRRGLCKNSGWTGEGEPEGQEAGTGLLGGDDGIWRGAGVGR